MVKTMRHDNIKNIRTIFIIVAGAFATMCMISVFLIEFDQIVGFQEVFEIELPVYLKIERQSMFCGSRDNTEYIYRSVVAGDSNILMQCVMKLGLREESPVTYQGRRYNNKVPIKWWTLPSWTKTEDYKFYHTEVGMFGASSNSYYRIQAELTSNKLYLLKVGDLKTLRANLRKRGGIYMIY